MDIPPHHKFLRWKAHLFSNSLQTLENLGPHINHLCSRACPDTVCTVM
jgi:hypothetical protein